ncbi:MAG: GNAT family N-acetyltransferase [Desulfovibrio sp.]|nr:GNAT family N-acetyltransferase [Desulfovibrio sp.]
MPADNPVLIALWRRAVTVSHTFLTEGNIESIETDVAAALPVLEIWVCESEKGVPLGFMGLKGAKVEMLFVEPASFGSGIGTGLLNYARQLHDTLTLDVNEQNSRAHDFYLRCGFRETGRSTLDAAGRPFPLIHMELNP